MVLMEQRRVVLVPVEPLVEPLVELVVELVVELAGPVLVGPFLAALAVVLPVAVVVVWVDPAPGFLALLVGLLAGLVCLACLLLALLGLLLRRVRGRRRGISGDLPVR